MKWQEIKESIIDDLSSRGLKDPSIRLKALEKIEMILRQNFPSYIENPDQLKEIEREELKWKIAEKKGRDLNSAEKSIINEIYYRISPPQLPPMHREKYRMCICPYCFISHKLTENLWSCDSFTCLQCGNTIPNSVKEQERLDKMPSIIRGDYSKGDIGCATMLKILIIVTSIIMSIILLFTCYNNTNPNPNEMTLAELQKEREKEAREKAKLNMELEIKATKMMMEKFNKVEQKKFVVVGVWADDFTTGLLWRILKDDKEKYILEMGEVGSSMWKHPHKLVKTKKNGQIVYKDVEEDCEEYYRIDSNGNLLVYDNYGYIATYKKVK